MRLRSMLVLTAAMGLVVSSAFAAPVAIPNHSFQDPVIPTDGNVFDEDPLDTDPGSPAGWTYAYTNNPPASESYGVQRPHPVNHFTRDVTGDIETAPFAHPFDGDQIGFINLNNDPLAVGGASAAQVDSGALGSLAAGTYALNFAVGARNTGSWRNLDYEIGLVGSISGELGTFTQQTMDPGNAAGNLPFDATATNAFNVVDMLYTLNVPLGSSLIGEQYSIRLKVENTGDSGTGGFTQAAFDNARLDFRAIPEPTSFVLMIGGLLMGMFVRRR